MACGHAREFPRRRPGASRRSAGGSGVHGDRDAQRRHRRRRGEDAVDLAGRGGCGRTDSHARRVCHGSSAAEGCAMKLITSVVFGFLLAAVPAAFAATSEVADAAMKADRAAVRAALARKADVNAPQVDGTTALHWAVEHDDIELTNLLIQAGARVAARTREGVTPIQLAAINGSGLMLDRLLKAGADPNAALTPSGDTALMMAARTGKTDAVRVLVEAGAGVNARETWGGTTPLMWAAAEG